MVDKRCFMNSERPCDLTCKAAFEVDDPVDNVDCYFIWLAYHFGEGFYEIKRSLSAVGTEPPPPGFPGPAPGPGPKPGKGFPNN